MLNHVVREAAQGAEVPAVDLEAPLRVKDRLGASPGHPPVLGDAAVGLSREAPKPRPLCRKPFARMLNTSQQVAAVKGQGLGGGGGVQQSNSSASTQISSARNRIVPWRPRAPAVVSTEQTGAQGSKASRRSLRALRRLSSPPWPQTFLAASRLIDGLAWVQRQVRQQALGRCGGDADEVAGGKPNAQVTEEPNAQHPPTIRERATAMRRLCVRLHRNPRCSDSGSSSLMCLLGRRT